MTDLARVIGFVTAYVGLLFLVAIWAERQEQRGRRVAGNPLVYSLSLAVYCTTWTYYGSVGFAASSGLLFLTIYLGPTLVVVVWWWVLRKLVRIKNAHRVTSLADLLSVRYGKSQSVAMLATVVIIVGLIPYIALQLKTMIATVALVTGHDLATAYPAIGRQVGLPIVLLMVLFTIVFGIRRLSPTERHPGMMVALAAECAVKLVAFLAAGAFVTYGLFDGFGDVFRRARLAIPAVAPDLLGREGGLATWLSHLLLAASAILFLPRQFHVAVVENSDERHIRTAMWLFPTYLLAINVFVLPLALGGLLLGHPAAQADTFVLRLPYEAGARGLSWLVFLGGFSAGTGMVMVETMTLATMISNHLFLPALELWPPLERLRRHLLVARWWAAAAVIFLAFAYERVFGSQYELVSIGLTSFAAVLQLAPAVAGGLYWRGASTAGALGGLGAGFAVLTYTLFVPILVRVGWLPPGLLTDGPMGISALRPEALFGMAGLDRLSHAVLWSMVFNVGAFVFGSLLFPAPEEEEDRAGRIVAALAPLASRPPEADPRVLAEAGEKRDLVVRLFAHYHGEPTARRLADACLKRVGTTGSHLSVLQLAELQAEVETALASSIGTAAAHAAIKRDSLVSPAEAKAISRAYGDILAGLRVSPTELQRKIDYHREREKLLAREAAAQRFLADVSGRLAASLDVETTGQTVVHLPVPKMVDAALLWMARPDERGPRLWFADVDPDRERQVTEEIAGFTGEIASHACVARALETAHPVVSPSEPKTAWPPPLARATPFSGDATFPLVASGRSLGTLTLFLSASSRFRIPEDVGLGEELAHRSAIALDNAALYRSAEDAVRARDEFLAVASHELKTPITPLRLNIQALQRLVSRGEMARMPEERLDLVLRGADGQIRRILGLLDDLLDVSRITTRRLRLELEATDLGAIVEDVVERHRSELHQAGCEVTRDLTPSAFGQWDRMRLEQVVTNLLTNAMKYAPGPIEVRVEIDGEAARLVVRDSGPGIAPEDQERIFRPFERAVSYLKASGFGLGLYIVRQIVDAHGGTIRLESTPGQGCTFMVTLPRFSARRDGEAATLP